MSTKDISVVICCAGMGTRLGIGSTKALIDICGKPIIIHLLELLDDFDDVRVVVGYQAERVIDVVNSYRKDIMFAFNYDYKTTGVAASLSKGIIGSRKYVIYIDGDLLVDKNDFERFATFNGECLAVSDYTSNEPISVRVNNGEVQEFLSSNGNFFWPGLAKIESNKLIKAGNSVFQILAQLLPLSAVKVTSQEINTVDDYERAINWFNR